jgi:hypothetical protein
VINDIEADLRTLFEARTAELSSLEPNPVEAVRDRAAAKRRKRRMVTVAGAASAAIMCVIVAGVAHGTTSEPTATPTNGLHDTFPVPPAVLEAVEGAQTFGHIDRPVEWIVTTEQGAAPLDHSGPGAPDIPIYAVQLRGRFVLTGASGPAGANFTPTGTVLILFVPISNPDRGGSGVELSNAVADLSRYGTVHAFTVPARTATVSGRATPCAGLMPNPPPRVTINATENGTLIATTNTDAAGRYTLKLPPGSYLLAFGQNSSAAITLRSGQKLHIDHITSCG